MMEWHTLEYWRTPVATTAVITTIAQFLAGSLVCRKYMKKGTAGEASGFPFVCGLLSSSLWLRYGLLKADNSIVLVNAIGVLLQSLYICIYYRYTPRKSICLYQTISILAIIAMIYGYVMYESNIAVALHEIGLLSCVVTLIFIAAPLTMLFHVMRVRSTETLPFPIILMSFIVCTLWFFYGIIVDDPFMIVPNAIGLILAALQLFLFVIYPNKPMASYNRLNQIM